MKKLIFLFIPIIILTVVNYLLPVTFTAYFIICAIALCLRNFNPYVSWSTIVTASVIVTVNYLHPKEYDNGLIYNNASHNVLVLKGVQRNNDLSLMDSNNPAGAIFDKGEYDGFLKVSRLNEKCILSYNITSQPLYIKKNGSDRYSLINKSQLIRFSKTLAFEFSDGRKAVLAFKSIKNDKMEVLATFKDSIIVSDTASFNREISVGYPLADILNSCPKENDLKDDLIALLKNVTICRDQVPCASRLSVEAPLFTTITSDLKEFVDLGLLEIFADDSKPTITRNADTFTEIVENGQTMYVGVGKLKSPIVKLCNNDGTIKMLYEMPKMYNFPTDTTTNAIHNLAVSSNFKDLLVSDVKEAFYFDIFENVDNLNHFNARINYQTSSSPNALNMLVLDKNSNDDMVNGNQNTEYYLTTKNNSKWILSKIDLRKCSPLTGKSIPWINDWFILGLILFLSTFSFTMSMLVESDSPYRSQGIFLVWMLFIPLLTLRMYLMWRIAVFPPVENILREEFMLYHLENGGLANSIYWTFMAIAVMTFVTIVVVIHDKLKDKYNNVSALRTVIYKLNGIYLSDRCTKFSFVFFISIAFGGAIFNKFIELPTVLKVIFNIVIPVSLFFFNEWLSQRGLRIGYRITSAVLVLVLLFLGDPGYSIMFFIFECIYFIILTVVYRNSGYIAGAYSAWGSSWALMAMLIVITLFAPQLMVKFYDFSPIIYSVEWLKWSNVWFAIVAMITVLVIYKLWSMSNDISDLPATTRRYLPIVAMLFIVGISFVGPKIFNANGHFKYRALIHIQDVGESMQIEDISKRDSRKLLEASQNQWFLEYHNELGKDRVTSNGIMHLYPHFKKGVSWNTQISDVICSRYIVGELSMLVPVSIICLLLVFLLLVMKSGNESSVGRTYGLGVALLLLVQAGFVWMANTNRMIFFGQDMPLLSHNAHSTMIMFALLLALVMVGFNNNSDTISSDLQDGYAHFARKPLGVFAVVFTLVFAIIYFTGNKYDNIYSGLKEYDVAKAMETAKAEFSIINSRLASYPAKGELKTRNLKNLVKDIDKKIEISNYVDELGISDFTKSLFNGFKRNYCQDNRAENIVHMRYISGKYQLAINNGFYCLKAPEMQAKGWSGNVYGFENLSEKASVEANLKEGVHIYYIPNSWLPKNSPKTAVVSIVNDKSKNEEYKLICSDGVSVNIASSLLLTEGDILQFDGPEQKCYSVDGNMTNMLAKNMVVNGVSNFFYPLGKDFFWVKNFTDYERSNKKLKGNTNCNLTIDMELMKQVDGIFNDYSYDFSVIALDGLGNVRLMYDSNEHPNPNDAGNIEALVEESYINPNYSRDVEIFGSMNLTHMLPGPGSSLKPITYAAVTSQTLNDIKWESLQLKKPDENKQKGEYFEIESYGPQYQYTGEALFQSPYKDERGNPVGWVDNKFYLYKSSNYYNALVTYLGYYSKAMLSNIKGNILKNVNENSGDYPIIKLDGNTYAFKNAPSSDNKSFVLATAFLDNFRLTIWRDNKLPITNFVSGMWYADSINSDKYPYLFPEQSNIYIFDASQDTGAKRLKQYTLGSSPLQITPLQMAEMYGRLFTMHPDFHASMIENSVPFNNSWNTDASPEEIFTFYKQNIFQPMGMCATIGTANFLCGKTNIIDNYYIYAKTGTLTIKKKVINDDKMLSVIITDKDITGASKPEDVKCYVVYFRFKQSSRFPEKRIIATIRKLIDSQSFKLYMNSNITKNEG